jgi:hypothetical protein
LFILIKNGIGFFKTAKVKKLLVHSRYTLTKGKDDADFKVR